MLDIPELLGFLTHSTLVEEGVLSKALSHVQPKFQHLMELVTGVGRALLARDDLQVPVS